MTRFRGEYIAERKQLHNAVRAEAGDRCVRCFHPGGDTPSARVACDDRCTHPRDDLGSVTVFPVVPDVTLPAHAQEVAEGICLAVVLQAEQAKRYDVRDGQPLGECVLALPASPARESVATPSSRPLRAPVRAVVVDVTALPVRAAGTAKAIGEPFQPARVAAESLRGVAERHLSLLSAALASIDDPPSLARLGAVPPINDDRTRPAENLATPGAGSRHLPLLAVLRAVTPSGHPRGWSAEQPSALNAWLANGHSEIYHISVGKMRILTCHHLDGNKANNAWWNLLALCQSCHLTIQGRVIPERPWLFDHSPWFVPYVCGFYASYYGGTDITREEANADPDRWLLLGQPWRERTELVPAVGKPCASEVG